MFSYKDFWIIALNILLVVYILGKSKHLITISLPHLDAEVIFELSDVLGLS